MYNNNETKIIADFISNKISYAEQHKKQDLELLYELVDVIANLMETEDERQYWYSLCNMIPPENYDENAIS